ncbi:anti-sigma factor [Kitasatospora sp. YST-16]|uniref:anti-sigma factor n=1 Tax=unclassified Kitasatospora TaxID=2633591 RepID=UPI0004C43CB3|nr:MULTISPECIES: anti-sigma factor [unclassified Kitasatospora]WAL70226.1 anti-sigma factor [Kitasatospora sp. YST-16]WNW36267.1 anti-sigma factor [Streptomyces sp. Li-HN-5-13]
MNTADLHTLTGAYAAHALEAQESLRFEEHLASCPSCTAEVAEFRATLARLGSAESAAPPASLKAAVMAALPTVRQDAPALAPRAGGKRQGDRWGRRWPRFALAACLAAALTTGAVAVQQHQEADRAQARAAALQQQQDRFADLLTAPDARTATAAATGGTGTGTVVWSHSRAQAAFLATALPDPAAGRTYQLWFADAGTMRPAGLLPHGTGTLLLTGTPDGADAVGLTLEPAGGSPHPSGAPIMLLPLS